MRSSPSCWRGTGPGLSSLRREPRASIEMRGLRPLLLIRLNARDVDLLSCPVMDDPI